MDFIKQHATLVFIAAIVLLGVFGYYYYFSQPQGDVLSASSSIPEGQSILSLLTNVQSVKLDDSIFQDQVFQSLTDFGTTIPPEPVGRTNPFAAVGAVSTQAPAAPKAAAGGAAKPAQQSTASSTHQ